MNPDQWAKQWDISREPVADHDPMERIKWAIQIFKGTIMKVAEVTP